MISETRFLISRKPYAVDLTSLRGSRTDTPQGRNEYYFSGQVDAVWFRRRKGITVACIGTLWDLQHPEPADAVQFLTRHEDGRYGGDCTGRWDGTGYWGHERPASALPGASPSPRLPAQARARPKSARIAGFLNVSGFFPGTNATIRPSPSSCVQTIGDTP